jgi:sugar lactone lactonase YvrE
LQRQAWRADGLTVDADGFLWSAVWDGWCIERYDPDGRLERAIQQN